jgi:glutaconyl-CoA/methylmalonyl-CoA decarboxylase subunit gamma
MRYYVTLDPTPGAEPIVVDVKDLPSGALEVRVGDSPVDVDVVALGDQLSVRMNGQVVDLTTEGAPPELGAIASGHRSYVRVESERLRAAEAAMKGAHGASEKVVKSPMPGRIVKVLVALGEEVAAGRPLFVMEAMKMENEIKAKGGGKVVELHVAIGDTVERNAKLVTLG